jgi:hypothetical protein
MFFVNWLKPGRGFFRNVCTVNQTTRRLISKDLSFNIYFRNDLTSQQTTKQTPWSESASELYRPSDRRLSAK